VIRGIASAAAGAVVAAVEVSVDGGRSWRLASGQENWGFAWVPQKPGRYVVLVRAVDDSLNLGSVVAGPVFVAVAPPLTRVRIAVADALQPVMRGTSSAVRTGRRLRQRLQLRRRLEDLMRRRAAAAMHEKTAGSEAGRSEMRS
jgi:hypothetical protein